MVFEGRGAVMNTSLRKSSCPHWDRRSLTEVFGNLLALFRVSVKSLQCRKMPVRWKCLDYLMTNTGTVLSDRTSAA